MSKALSEITKEALDLSDEDDDFSPSVEEKWDLEISRRLDFVRSGQAQSRPFEEVMVDLDRRFAA